MDLDRWLMVIEAELQSRQENIAPRPTKRKKRA
jgi:hypothetical protein